jgi:hypothetical protein
VLDEYHPQQHGRIGQFLVQRGIVTSAIVESVIDFQRSMMTPDVRPAV